MLGNSSAFIILLSCPVSETSSPLDCELPGVRTKSSYLQCLVQCLAHSRRSRNERFMKARELLLCKIIIIIKS